MNINMLNNVICLLSVFEWHSTPMFFLILLISFFSFSLKPECLVCVLSFLSLYLSSSSKIILNSCSDICPSFKAVEIKVLIEFNLFYPRVLIS